MQQSLDLKQVTYLHVLNILESHESKLIQSACNTEGLVEHDGWLSAGRFYGIFQNHLW